MFLALILPEGDALPLQVTSLSSLIRKHETKFLTADLSQLFEKSLSLVSMCF